MASAFCRICASLADRLGPERHGQRDLKTSTTKSTTRQFCKRGFTRWYYNGNDFYKKQGRTSYWLLLHFKNTTKKAHDAKASLWQTPSSDDRQSLPVVLMCSRDDSDWSVQLLTYVALHSNHLLFFTFLPSFWQSIVLINMSTISINSNPMDTDYSTWRGIVIVN